jgi:hypothetical protein
MNRNIPVQVAYDRTNKGVDVREASTANFLIDSEDRSNYNATTFISNQTPIVTSVSSNFQITKPGQNLVSGFFTRLSMTEITMNWNVYNVNSSLFNNDTGLSVRTTSNGAISNSTITLPRGNYTVKQGLDALVAKMNTVTGLTFTLVDSQTIILPTEPYGRKAIQAPAGKTFAFFRSTTGNTQYIPATGPFMPNLTQSLGFIVYNYESLPLVVGDFQSAWVAYKPMLLPYKYIDITCSQLASQQKVKDATTSSFDAIDVIYRWNFVADDANPITYDDYDYPILPGYLPFSSKRSIQFPKQVRWDPLIPIGNLSFQTYTDQETILTYNQLEEDFEFKMLMLVSEV